MMGPSELSAKNLLNQILPSNHFYARKLDATPLTDLFTTKQELIDAADLVTEMTLVKHPFRSGIKAQPGVEF